MIYFISAFAVILLILFLGSFICYRMVFYSPKRHPLGPDEYDIPDGDIYEVFRDDMIEWTKAIRTMPHEDVEIRSKDGLTLRGKYYEYEKDAPVELLFHGYKGNAERDLSGGVERCFRLGRSKKVFGYGHLGGVYRSVYRETYGEFERFEYC